MRARRSGASLAALVVLAAGAGWAVPGCQRDPGSAGRPQVGVSDAVVAPSAGAASRPSPTGAAGQDPARYAAAVRTYAGRAGVNPQLLMAILYNESDKPHDPALERAWQKMKPDAAFGIANMHQSAFDDTKRGRDFADRQWQELPDDPGLAVEAAAWYLHDLAARLPVRWVASYTKDELLALGYNAGPASMIEFAHGAKPGEVAQTYLDRLHGNWVAAGTALQPAH
ncbi:transglycosylase SLT domain-containing protein [Dactylosporangium sp. NPDC048998]|uniref:transglycosylase SLT domain-containing protein n=1 Tax=Dactylosporangium sp. NPDC048998 TaxID=3363976 RepID=UPI00372300FF